MQYVYCNLCGADDTRLLFNAKERDWGTGENCDIVRCRKCGLVYVNPRPEKDAYKKNYPPETWPRAKRKMDPAMATIHNRSWKEIMKVRSAHLLSHVKHGRVLDIGCGDGFFLRYLKDLGWEVHGVEPGETASKYAHEILDLNVLTGNLEEAGYSDNSFDAVSLYAVLEHLPNPRQTLQKVKKILKPEGILFICVPNFDSLESKIFKSRWLAIKAPSHLYHFTPVTLSRMVIEIGFKTPEIRHFSSEGGLTIGYSESLRYVLSDYRLYHTKKNPAAESGNYQNEQKKTLWKKKSHAVEKLIFNFVGDMADQIGMGSDISLIAKK